MTMLADLKQLEASWSEWMEQERQWLPVELSQ